jgi:hypothetical protein
VLKALAKLGHAEVADAVHEVAITDESFGVRATAAETLSHLGDPRGFPLLFDQLWAADNPWPHSYRWLAKLTVELDAANTVPDTRRSEIWRASLAALGTIAGDPGAEHALTRRGALRNTLAQAEDTSLELWA